MTLRGLALAAGAATWLLGSSAGLCRAQSPVAQPERRVLAEGRLDAIMSRARTAQAGIGAIVAAGTYARIVLGAGAGATRRPGGNVLASARAELTVRFLLDPVAQARWAPYLAGGLGYLDEGAGRRRGVMLLAIGLEGPRSRRGTRAAVEAGLGGGLRLGLVLRRSRTDAR